MSDSKPTVHARGACRPIAVAFATASLLVTLSLSDDARVPVAAQALPLASGEQIRVELAEPPAVPTSVASPWEGTFMMQRGDTLVARTTYGFDAVLLPLSDVEAVYARRDRGRAHAFVRGAVAGAIFGVLGWQFLNVLCRSACEHGLDNAWLPAAGAGMVFAVLVVGQGPGQHWVRVDEARRRVGSGR